MTVNVLSVVVTNRVKNLKVKGYFFKESMLKNVFINSYNSASFQFFFSILKAVFHEYMYIFL